MDEAARLCGEDGEFAIITASLTASNMNEWQKHIEARRASKYPKMKMVALRPCDDLKGKAQAEVTTLLSANPNLKLIMAICSPAVPGAAEAVTQARKTGALGEFEIQCDNILLGKPSTFNKDNIDQFHI